MTKTHGTSCSAFISATENLKDEGRITLPMNDADSDLVQLYAESYIEDGMSSCEC